MGKYTSLARKIEETEPQESFVDKGETNSYKHSTLIDINNAPVPPSEEGVTNLRTTKLTNLIGPRRPNLRGDDVQVTCIHETTVYRCAVCSGFVRWLIADDRRMRRAEVDPEVVRRDFWQAVKGDL
jgi:hypothetical protein